MKKVIVSVVLLIVLISACAPVEPTATPTATTVPTATASPTATSTPTITPTPTNTPTPTMTPTITPLPNQDELIEIWQPAVNGITLQAMVCPMIIDTAVKLQNEEIDSWGAFGEMFIEALILASIDESYPDWEPEPEVSDHKALVLEHNLPMRNVLADWFNDEITSVDVPGLLEDKCPQIETDAKMIVDDAKAHGLSDASIEAMLLEIEEGFEEFQEELEDF